MVLHCLPLTQKYIQAISKFFPNILCESDGDGSVYETIVSVYGGPIPEKSILDTLIDNYVLSTSITKYEFRRLFTFNERVAIDNSPDNVNIPIDMRMVLKTVLNDFSSAEEIDLNNPDVANGVNLLENLGIISLGRATQILNKIPV